MTDVIGVTTNDRTTVSLRARDGSFTVALKYFAEDPAKDFGTTIVLTTEQAAEVRGFFGRIQESP